MQFLFHNSGCQPFRYVIILCVSVVAAAPAQTSVACPDSSAADCGEEKQCLLHTRTRLGSLDGITENIESRIQSSTYELDYLAVLHKYAEKRHGRESFHTSAQMTSQAAQRSAWVSYQGTLNTVLTSLESKRHSATGELEDTIDKFIAKQAGSEDACHAQLLEAKHQLNQLHLHVDDLSRHVNATDHEVTALNAQVESKLEESERLEEECQQKLEEIEGQQKEDLVFLETLRNELDEMIQIANPDVTMNQTAGKVLAGGKVLESLLGMPAEAFLPFLPKIKIPSVQTLVQTGITSTSFIQMNVENDGLPTQVRYNREELVPLKAAMKHVAKCMKRKDKFSLVAARQDPAPIEVDLSDPAATTPEPIDMKIDLPTNAPAQTTPEAVDVKTSLPTIPPSKDIVCATDDVAKVEVGGVAGEVSPPRGLAQDESAQIPCVQLNKEYFGAIWLTCDEDGLTASATQCLKAANPTTCKEELEVLQKVYIKTYVDLARLIQQYEEKTREGYEAQKNAIEDECRDRREPIQNDAAKLATQVSEKVKTLEELRPKLEDALDAYHKLKEQVSKLSEQCKALPETITDLDKVRDAIKALSLCPGLNKARLIVPKWIGQYAEFDVASSDMPDEEYDVMMLETCEKYFGGDYPDKVLRAASVAEIAAGAVLDLPLNNTAEIPLIGPCPACKGHEDAEASSGHLRVCWKPGAELNNNGRTLDCNEGLKSIACVVDGDK